jgi:hypothetical protein
MIIFTDLHQLGLGWLVDGEKGTHIGTYGTTEFSSNTGICQPESDNFEHKKITQGSDQCSGSLTFWC